ncbi:2-hydroxychromene-2-carboxylate isomerase [Marinibaculum pumilum]|uniref:2-hydroxychromene-2-carboxylate isomerase n=1 Tax=Marinibaculum pumilum TaxID=1766165 RepID=A0ABV7L3X1_9PROT
MAGIEYFYSAHSVFAYIGAARFHRIAAAAGRTVRHRPIDLNRLLRGIGGAPFAGRSPGHMRYFFGREIARWAQERDAPVCGHVPAGHDADMALPNGLLIAVQAEGGPVDALSQSILQAHWRDDTDITDPDALAPLLAALGLAPAPLLQAARSAAVRAAYDANIEEAVARSVFGSPTYIVDGDMFYGQDRLEMVEKALQAPYPGRTFGGPVHAAAEAN